MADDALDYLLFRDWIAREEHKCTDWVIVARHMPGEVVSPWFTQCALLRDDETLLTELFREPSFGFDARDAGMPGYNCAGGEPEYFSDSALISPFPARALTIYRHFPTRYPSYFELLQEFVLYHEAHYDETHGQWVTFDECGQDLIVAKRYQTEEGEHGIEVWVPALRDFLTTGPFVAVRGHDHRREVQQIELPGDQETLTETIREDLRLVEAVVTNGWTLRDVTSSRLLGFDIIRPLKEIPAHRRWWDESVRQYERFIVDIDEDGTPVERSCGGGRYEDDGVGGAQGLTPVYFRLEVLDRYRGDPERYARGWPAFGHKWGLRAYDVNDAGLVTVYLKDLADLPYEEQRHWKQFNVAPSGGITREMFSRDFLLQPLPPRDLVTRLRHALDRVCVASRAHLGFDLFLPLHPTDAHVEDGLHFPIADRAPDLDQQVGALAKLLSDSINQSELEQLTGIRIDPRGQVKGRTDLLRASLCHLGASQTDADAMVQGLRDAQTLRSVGAAHRRGQNWHAALGKAGLSGMSCSEIHRELLRRLLDSLDRLHAFLESLATRDQDSAGADSGD